MKASAAKSTPASSAGHLIAFHAPLKNLDGSDMRGPAKPVSSRKPLQAASEDEQPVAEGEVIKLGAICIGSLQAPLQTDAALSVDQKMEMGDLCQTIWGAMKRNKPVPVTVAERDMLIERINKTQPLLPAHQAIRILDPARVKEAAA